MAVQYTRLYLVPIANQPQQVIDVDSSELILTGSGYVLPAVATDVVLLQSPVAGTFTPFETDGTPMDITSAVQRTVRVCWREPVDSQLYPNEEVEVAVDPSGGECVCLVTCNGTQITYAQVVNVVSN
jgi:hypothetical protein